MSDKDKKNDDKDVGDDIQRIREFGEKKGLPEETINDFIVDELKEHSEDEDDKGKKKVSTESLYHGSGYKQDELKPGFAHSGVLVQWDETESNEFLYATTDRDEAIEMAFASIMEKQYKVNRVKTRGKNISITLERGEKVPTEAQLAGLKIYLYTLAQKGADGWVKVNNQVNGMDNEYKTKTHLTDSILHREEIDVKDWLASRHLSISTEGLGSFGW